MNLAENIKDYILTEKSKENMKHVFEQYGPHKVFTGDAYSNHHRQEITKFLQEVEEKVAGCSKLLENIEICIDNYVTTSSISKCKIMNSWFNIQKPGSGLTRHSHIGGVYTAYVSGALYINVDENSPPIMFENPNPYNLITSGGNKTDTYSFTPMIGDLIIFPAWLSHLSEGTNKTDHRIVISFNAIHHHAKND